MIDEHHQERAEHRAASGTASPSRRASPPPTYRCRRGSTRIAAGTITKVTENDSQISGNWNVVPVNTEPNGITCE